MATNAPPEQFADLMVGPWRIHDDDEPKAAVEAETGIFGTLFLRQAHARDADRIELGFRVTAALAWQNNPEEDLEPAL